MKNKNTVSQLIFKETLFGVQRIPADYDVVIIAKFSNFLGVFIYQDKCYIFTKIFIIIFFLLAKKSWLTVFF